MRAPAFTLLGKHSGVWLEPGYLAAMLVNFGHDTRVLFAYEAAKPVAIREQVR